MPELPMPCKWIIDQRGYRIGTSNPDTSAILDIVSTNKGVLLPRVDFNNLPNPATKGMTVFVTANGPEENNAIYCYNGTEWLMMYHSYYIGQNVEGGIVFLDR